MTTRNEEKTEALLKFVQAVDAAGGVFPSSTGPFPKSWEEWTELGEAYLAACAALKRDPKLMTAEEYGGWDGAAESAGSE